MVAHGIFVSVVFLLILSFMGLRINNYYVVIFSFFLACILPFLVLEVNVTENVANTRGINAPSS